MTFANPAKAAENVPVLSTESFQPNSHRSPGFKQIFVGPNGLRAGWRVLMFIALSAVLMGAFALIRAGGPAALREGYKTQSQVTITPLLMGGSEALTLLFLGIAALAMGKLEHRKFAEYGLPLRLALKKDFWVGSLIGFSAISGTLLTIFLLHGFRITGLAIHGTAILYSLVGWGIAFLFAGLVEEFLFRGYIQYTLTDRNRFLAGRLLDVRLVRLGPLLQFARDCARLGDGGPVWPSPVPVFAAHWKSLVRGRLSSRLRLGTNVLRSSRQRHRALPEYAQLHIKWPDVAHRRIGWSGGQFPHAAGAAGCSCTFQPLLSRESVSGPETTIDAGKNLVKFSRLRKTS